VFLAAAALLELHPDSTDHSFCETIPAREDACLMTRPTDSSTKGNNIHQFGSSRIDSGARRDCRSCLP
jgi:hypothetical protein